MAFLWRFHEKSGLYLDFNRLEKGRFDEYVSGTGLSTLTVLDFLSHPSSCTLCTDLRRHGLSLELLSNHGTIILQSHYPGRACQTAAAGGHIDFEMLLMTRGCSFFLLMVKRARKNWATILGRSSFGLTCGNQLWADGEQPVLCFAEDKPQSHRVEDFMCRGLWHGT